ncbi:MAG TPA: GNAT family N-acetyltransferase [Solirubrobacteraceae bacterium]|nr:GNAT family N-acetyltransferase [Solirubrobacteraceae bacterium]
MIVFGTSDIGAHIFPERRGAYQRWHTHWLVSASPGTRLRIRDVRREDVGLIFDWIVELAEYERSRDLVRGTPELLEDALFGAEPSAEALIAEARDDGGTSWQSAGFALFHLTFSTWECRPGIWLEDLYVPPAQRRAGVGVALISHLARLTVARGYTRLEWSALDWNTPALDFYTKIGAARLDEWKVHRLDGPALDSVAARAQSLG